MDVADSVEMEAVYIHEHTFTALSVIGSVELGKYM